MEISFDTIKHAWQYRKWYFFLVSIPIIIGMWLYAQKLPPVYESKATILVEQQQIPPEYVRSTVTGIADQHIQILTQQILSRVKLWEIIESNNLYPELRRKATKEAVIDEIRKNIKITTIGAEVGDKGRKGGQNQMTIAFTIAYQGSDPKTVQKVTAILSSLYLEQNLRYREAQAQTTTRFLEAELTGLKEQIQNLGEKITQFKEKNEGLLPEMQQYNHAQVDRLENELKQIDAQLRATESQKIYLESLLKSGFALGSDKEKGAVSPAMRLQALRERLAELQARYSPDHPDVQKTLREKEQLEKLLKEGVGNTPAQRQKLQQLQTKLVQLQSQYGDQHPEVKQAKAEIAKMLASGTQPADIPEDVDLANPAAVNLVTQVNNANNEINALKQQRQNVLNKLGVFRQRLELAPKVEQEYLALQRDYQNAHTKYQEVLNKLMEARIAEGMEEHQKGEKFTLVDPASVPESPIKPNRLAIKIGGIILGIVAGSGLMLGLELIDNSVKTLGELVEITGEQPLGVIGRIENPQEVSARKRRRLLLAASAFVSILLGLAVIHLFIADLWLVSNNLIKKIEKFI